MTTIESSPDAVGAARGETAIGSFPATLAAWLITSDHKRIGRLFLGGSFLGLAATAVIGVLLGIERVDGSDVLLDSDAIPQLFQLYRIGLVSATLMPIGIGLSIAVVPLQLGARSLAFPRLALAGFYGWLAGLVLVIVALANNGGIGGGDADMVDLFLVALVLMSFGLIAAAVSIATSVLTTRAPGMSMRRVPLFSWSALVTAIGVLLTLPVLVGTLVFLVVDHRNAGAVFGGNDGIGDWIGWAFTQPATYVFALPAIGVAAELFPVTFGRRQVMRGVVYTGLALVGVGALSAVTQQNVHGLPWSGSGLDTEDLGTKFDGFVPYALFNLLPVLGVLIVMAIGALMAKGGRPSITSPFLFGFLGVGMIFVGMLGGGALPDRRPGAPGHGVRGGRARLHRLRSGAVHHGWRRVLGAQALGSDVPRQAGDGARRSRLDRDRARLAAVLRGRLRRSTGGVADVRLQRPGRALERVGPGRTRADAAHGPRVRRSRCQGAAGHGRWRRRPGRRSVGRPDGRMDHHLAGTVRQLCRGARHLLG